MADSMLPSGPSSALGDQFTQPETAMRCLCGWKCWSAAVVTGCLVVLVIWLVVRDQTVNHREERSVQPEQSPTRDERWLRIRLGSHPDVFAAIREAPRAIVFLR